MQNISEDLNGFYFIPGHVPSSKNSRIFNVSMKRSFKSKSSTKYIKESKPHWEEIKEDFLKIISEKSTPYLIGFHFVRKTRAKYDWVNPLQTVQDIMTELGLLEDDNVEVLIPFPLKIKGSFSSQDSKNPGVFIKIM
jgi:Holliday junction resolvase RusA-like endonuclease